jgi:Secretion system C-terminal sorting domain
MAVDRKGNLYLSDVSNQRVRKINAAGIITTVAGDGTGVLHLVGPATACGIGGTGGICCDDTGNLYMYAQYRILKVDTFGIITSYAGNGGTGYGGDGGLADTAKFNGVEGLAMDKDHNFYVCEVSYVRKITASRMVSTIAAKFTAGSGLATGDGGPATAARFGHLWEISPDRCGNLYIGDPLNNRVRVVNGGGYINTFAGTGYGGTGSAGGSYTGGHTGDGGPATAARLYCPSGVFVDEEGGVYIRDAYNNVIRYIHMDSCKNTTEAPSNSPQGGEVLSVYPNPNSGFFTLNLSSPVNEPANVVVTNIMGAEVMRFITTTNKETEINLHVAKGMYFFCVSTESGRWVRKVVVN